MERNEKNIEKYDIKLDEEDPGSACGFYVWNKPTIFIDESDNRYEEAIKMKKNTGISMDETWSLYDLISVFMVPRLKAFKAQSKRLEGHPFDVKNFDEWEKILDKMIFAFNAALYNDWKAPKEYLEKYESEKEALQKYNEDIQEGLNLFAKHYFDLWW